MTVSSPRIAIIFYSMYGHIAQLAEAIKSGIESAGGEATILLVPETLPENILGKLRAPTKPNYPVAAVNSLKEYDAFLFGVPARYGGMPAQWKTFWDATGQLWAKGALTGKYAGLFVSTSAIGAGQEETAFNFMSTLVHHGIIYVPLGYKPAFKELTSLHEPRGGSPWGSGILAGNDNERQPSPLEITIAESHGRSFYDIVSRVKF